MEPGNPRTSAHSWTTLSFHDIAAVVQEVSHAAGAIILEALQDDHLNVHLKSLVDLVTDTGIPSSPVPSCSLPTPPLPSSPSLFHLSPTSPPLLPPLSPAYPSSFPCLSLLSPHSSLPSPLLPLPSPSPFISCLSPFLTPWADRKVEGYIISSLSTRFPSSKFLAEEAVSSNGLEGEVLSDEPTWIIDPIDGLCRCPPSFSPPFFKFLLYFFIYFLLTWIYLFILLFSFCVLFIYILSSLPLLPI